MNIDHTTHDPLALPRRFFGTKLAGIPPALLCVGVCIFLVVSSISSSTGTISESQIVSYPAESAHPADSAYSYAGDGADELPQYPYQHDAPLQSHGRLLSELAAENPVISLIGVLGSLFTCLTICQARTPCAPARPPPPCPPRTPRPESLEGIIEGIIMNRGIIMNLCLSKV